MGMMQDVVTVYNKYVDEGVEKWQRTVLSGVFWDAVKGAVARRTGVQSADSMQIIIPLSVTASRASYLPPKAWAACTDKSGFWTLRSGDIVVRGAVAREISRSSKELRDLDDVLAITSADTKRFGGGMAHWEVSGK